MSILKKSNEVLAELFSAIPTIKDLLKKPFAVEKEIISAWARPKASDINPVATGKGNPLDRVDKLIEIAHVYDPQEARKIANYFTARCDYLDRQAGINEANEFNNPCSSIARVVEAQAKLINASIAGCDEPENMTEVLSKAQILYSAVTQLIGCVKGILQKGEATNK